MRRVSTALLVWVATMMVAPASAQSALDPARVAPGQTCTVITQANADASAGAVNINHDGTPLAGVPAPDISRGFKGIPRSAQPPLTVSQRRILECTYRLAEANADMPYALFVPSSYDPKKPAPLVVDLHGLNITPLQQILFDGTTDLAERYGFIVLAPMGYNLSSWWGSRTGTPSELGETDAMTVLKLIREKFTIDSDRIYLMGHSMGGAGTYYLGGKYNDIWAGLAAISGAGGIADGTAERYKSLPTLIMHGGKDSIVAPATSRRVVAALQAVGAPHLYLEFPDKDHEFWIRRGAAQMEKVFLFFSLVSKRTTVNTSAGGAADMTGTWDINARFSIEGGPGDGQSTDMKAVLVLTEKDKRLTGTFTPYAADGKTTQPAMPIVDGLVDGAKVTFSVKQDDRSLAFALALVNDQLRGDATPSKPVDGGGKLTITVAASRRK